MAINDRQGIVIHSHFRRADGMKDRRSNIAGGPGKGGLAVIDRWPWKILLRTKKAERLLLHQTASDPNRVRGDASILVGRKIVRCDHRFRRRVSRAQANGAAGRRAKIAGCNRDRWKAMQRITKLIEGERLTVKLDVWAVEVER